MGFGEGGGGVGEEEGKGERQGAGILSFVPGKTDDSHLMELWEGTVIPIMVIGFGGANGHGTKIRRAQEGQIAGV